MLLQSISGEMPVSFLELSTGESFYRMFSLAGVLSGFPAVGIISMPV